MIDEFAHLLPRVIDVHNHIQESPDLPNLIQKLNKLTIKACCVMGTHPNDWPIIAQILEKRKQTHLIVIPSFGCHPWFAHKYPHDQVIEELKIVLKMSSQSFPITDFSTVNPMESVNCLMGEIGLDKISKDLETGIKPPFQVQMQLFKSQFQLALDMNLPMSIHAVQCVPEIISFFKEQSNSLQQVEMRTVPNIMLHSFPGSPDTIKQLLTIPIFGNDSSLPSKRSLKKGLLNWPAAQNVFYFSVSWIVNGRSPSTEKWKERIRAIPDDRVLIESDLGSDVEGIPLALLKAAWMVSQAKEWSMESTIDRLLQNSLSYLKPGKI